MAFRFLASLKSDRFRSPGPVGSDSTIAHSIASSPDEGAWFFSPLLPLPSSMASYCQILWMGIVG